jgi:hypothetical protein
MAAAARHAAEQRYSWTATWGAALETVLERESIRSPQKSSRIGGDP